MRGKMRSTDATQWRKYFLGIFCVCHIRLWILYAMWSENNSMLKQGGNLSLKMWQYFIGCDKKNFSKWSSLLSLLYAWCRVCVCAVILPFVSLPLPRLDHYFIEKFLPLPISINWYAPYFSFSIYIDSICGYLSFCECI